MWLDGPQLEFRGGGVITQMCANHPPFNSSQEALIYDG